MYQKIGCLLLTMMLAFSCFPAIAEGLTVREGVEIPVVDNLKSFELPENDALRFIRQMRMGFDLGNTFDAYVDGDWFKKGEPEMETAWVGVKTSRELIQALVDAGFGAIRIPVSWHNHVDENDQINELWMARVRDVVDWALEAGLTVIVNVHHDNRESCFYPDRAHEARSREYLTAIWSQMAESFADCGEKLVLESMNEPRLVDTQYEWYWTASSPECLEAAEVINELNQLFVDTVRATGGNNATRYLAVPAYDASPIYAANEAFQLPRDSAENRIIVAAHAYTPYNFALNLQSDDTTFTLEQSQKKAEISTFLNGLYDRFVSQGIPVMMDEFGALEKNGNVQDRVTFTAYYVASASARGITCFWWDNHVFTGDGERFGLIDRRTVKWVYPEIVLAMRENCLYNREEAAE